MDTKMDESYAIASFRSRTQVLRFDQILRRERVNSSVITTPHIVAIGCGLSVRFAVGDLNLAKEIYDRSRLSSLVGFYIIENQSGRTRVINVRNVL